MTYDEERFSINTAWLRKGGEHFEVVVDPDAAIAFRQSDAKNDIREVVKSGHVFFDAKKGDIASEQHMKDVFGTSEPFVVAAIIVREGQIQLTKEHRDKLREQKRARIVNIIQCNAIDPRAGTPHPRQRIELAFEEARIHIDEFRKAEDQVQDVIKKLQPILPIRFERRILEIIVPAQYAGKLYSTISGYGTIRKQDWLTDGSWLGEAEVPAGLVAELMDELNNKTHGGVQVNERSEH